MSRRQTMLLLVDAGWGILYVQLEEYPYLAMLYHNILENLDEQPADDRLDNEQYEEGRTQLRHLSFQI